VYRPSWTMAEVGEHLAAIRDRTEPVTFPVVPDGHNDHIRYSFGMAGAMSRLREEQTAQRGAAHA